MRILSYNIQAGIGSASPKEYISKVGRQFFDTKGKRANVKAIAKFIKDFDVVCLQEVDLGGLRSGFQSQLDTLQRISGHQYVHAQTNRTVGPISVHGNAILSKTPIREDHDLKLPGNIKGRGAMVCRIKGLSVVNTHLGLSAAGQSKQLEYITAHLNGADPIAFTGDLNCSAKSEHLIKFAAAHDLQGLGGPKLLTFPAWSPVRDLDHILVSSSVGLAPRRTYDLPYSDHLPISAKLKL